MSSTPSRREGEFEAVTGMGISFQYETVKRRHSLKNKATPFFFLKPGMLKVL